MKFKKDKQADVNKNINANKVKIVVKRLIGGKIPYTIREFVATENKVDNNLTIHNIDNNFKEELIPEPLEEIENLKNKLNDARDEKKDKKGNKPSNQDINIVDYYKLLFIEKNERLTLVKQKITLQEKIVKNITAGYYIDPKTKQKTPRNKIDEENKLNQYRVFKFLVTNEGEGSYEEMDKDGYRKLTFYQKKSGLYPVFHNTTTCTMYPDIGTKRKQFREEMQLLMEEKKNELGSPWMGFLGKLLQFAWLILLIGTMFLTVQLYDRIGDYERLMDEGYLGDIIERADLNALKCNAYYTQALIDGFIDISVEEIVEEMEKDDVVTPIENLINLNKD